MLEDLDKPSNEYETYTWHEVWLKALTQPRVEAYMRLIRDPHASPNKAYGWVFICSTLAFIISTVLGFVLGTEFNTDSISALVSSEFFSFSIVWLACCSPFVGLLAVVGVALQAGIIQLVGRMLGGTGSYSDLVYAIAAYSAPLSIVTGILYSIPFVNLCLAIPIGIYSLILSLIAINAVNQFGWGKAIASAIILPLVIGILIGCTVIMILSLLGPQIGDVFSEIIRELSTPVSTGA